MCGASCGSKCAYQSLDRISPESCQNLIRVSPEVHQRFTRSSEYRHNVASEHLERGDNHDSAFPRVALLSNAGRCLFEQTLGSVLDGSGSTEPDCSANCARKKHESPNPHRITGACEKETPPERKTREKTSFPSTRSGGGEQCARNAHVYVYIYIYIHVYTYVYIYILYT